MKTFSHQLIHYDISTRTDIDHMDKHLHWQVNKNNVSLPRSNPNLDKNAIKTLIIINY